MSHYRKSKFFYGYVIVLTTFLIMVFTWGINYTFGIFLKPMSEELGWSRSATSGAFSLCFIIFGLSGIVTGKMNDRFGPRVVTTCCSFFLGSGFMPTPPTFKYRQSLLLNCWQPSVEWRLPDASG